MVGIFEKKHLPCVTTESVKGTKWPQSWVLEDSIRILLVIFLMASREQTTKSRPSGKHYKRYY